MLKKLFISIQNINSKLRAIVCNQRGQLLTEVLVAVAVGGVLLIAATAGILSVIRHNYESRSSQTAAVIAYDLINKTKSFANSDWHNIYNLAHGVDNKYHLVSYSAISSLDLNAGLAAYWKFDETGTTSIDSSGNSNNATLGSITHDTVSNCVFGTCVYVAGGQLATVASNATLNITDAITVSYWFYPKSSTADYASHPFMKWTSIYDANYVMYFFGATSGIQDYIGFLANAGGVWKWVAPPYHLTLNNWYHIVWTYSSSGGGNLYINGALVPGGPLGGGALATSSAPLYFGSDVSDSSENIDDARIYNRVLSPDEIRQLYSNPSNISHFLAVSGQESVLANDIQAGLVGYWKFDETSSSTAFDYSDNGNVGALMNNPTRTASSSCAVGNCLGFDGSTNYVTIPDNNLLDVSGNLSISAWVKWNSFKNYGIIVEKGPANGSVATINYTIWSYAGNTIMGYIGNGSTYNSVGYGSSSVLTTGVWHLINLVVDGSNFNIYVDGTLRASTTQTVTPAANTYPLYITAPTFTLDGLIDDVRVYNRALSANEISQLYNSSVYSRYFYVENVNRTVCSVGDITTGTSTSCVSVAGAGSGDIADDPSTQKINAVVVRSDGVTSQYYEYATRSKNMVFSQTDWSGGSGQEGPYTAVGTGFSSFTNITAAGTLTNTDKVNDGTLYSSTFDTQVTAGAAFNSIAWQGTLTTGSAVKFQIASSNTIGGTGGDPTGGIDSVYRYAWNDKIGWVDFGYAPGNVTVGSSQLTGYAYNDDVGEISLDCATSPSSTPNICNQSNYKVLNTTGNLSGWAWNDEIGWISFCGGQSTASCPGTVAYGVNINQTTGVFTGFAWNDNIGWISFNCINVGACGASDYKVSTTNTGGWKYLGPDGTSLHYYMDAGLDRNVSQPLTLRYHNNHRYVRYKVVITPSGGQSPTVSQIILNWSP